MADNRLGIYNAERKLIGGGRRPSSRSSGSNDEFFVGNASEKRYLWTARAFAVITAISLCCNLILIIAISQVVPLFRVEPFLLTFQNKQEQVYDIQPIKNNMEDEKNISEAFVRQYVLMRSSFTRDVPEMEARWLPNGPVQEMSSPSVYQDFLKNTAEIALQVIRTRQMTREVKILSVIEISKGVWQVEYESRDMYPNSSRPEVNYWTAHVYVTYRPKSVKYGERLKNPVGFTVYRYNLVHNKVNASGQK